MNRQEYLESVGRKTTYICRHCGKSYLPKVADRTAYCSRDCYFAEKTKRKEERIKRESSRVWYCKICRIKMSTYRVYCSRECEKEQRRREAYIRNSAKKILRPRLCKECGEIFTSQYGDKKREFCSIGCRKKYTIRIVGAGNYRKRARHFGVAYEYVNVLKAFRRDSWHCQICGKATPKERRGSRYSNAPELDHRVPMSKGGGHLYSNVQCACRKCNAKKSNNSEVGQLPLYEIESITYKGVPPFSGSTQ